MKNTNKRREEVKNKIEEIATSGLEDTVKKEALPPHLIKPLMLTILVRIKGKQINTKGEQETGTADLFVNHSNTGKGMVLALNNFIEHNPAITILGCEVVNYTTANNILTEKE